MTCEVAVANKLAIALAADSAVTFSGGGSQQTYASGANKIFQLANSEPVAVMIYNGASISGVSWEVILKAYRSEVANGGYKRLPEYATNLINFLNTCSIDLIPPRQKFESEINFYILGLQYVVRKVIGQFPIIASPDTDQDTVKNLWKAGLNHFINTANNANFCMGLEQNDYDLVFNNPENIIEKIISIVPVILKNDVTENFSTLVNHQDLAVAGIIAAFKYGDKFPARPYTGVVIAGFGQDDYLPGYRDFKFYGFLGGKIFYSIGGERTVDHNGNGSIIEAFARRSMVETFTQGASPEVWTAVSSAFENYAAKVCIDAANKSNAIIDPAIIREAISEHSRDFNKNWTYAVFDGHLKPLYRVVTGLSVEELAELAETLVLLESLKEKVTQRTQSVGGPIDVAVITKAEGLVWIKRKMYFDPAINQRYFRRMDALHGERNDNSH